MRFRGTGTHVQYPENVVVDLDVNDASGVTLVSEGAIEPLPLDQDPGRTPSQIAAAAQRGELGLGSTPDPVDRALAINADFVDPLGRPTPLATKEVQGDGLVQGEQPEKVTMLDDQRGVDIAQVQELAANVEKERAEMRKSTAEKLQDATINMSGGGGSEALRAQEAGEEANPQASTEGEGVSAAGSETQTGEVGPGQSGGGEAEDEKEVRQTTSRSRRTGS